MISVGVDIQKYYKNNFQVLQKSWRHGTLTRYDLTPTASQAIPSQIKN